MGYPMTFSRFIYRNGLDEYARGYDLNQIAGDLLRWVENTQDHLHVEFLSQASGATEDQVRVILAYVFSADRTITVNDMPFGGNDAIPDGAELTVRADRKRIAELEAKIERQNDNFYKAINIIIDRVKRDKRDGQETTP